MTTTVRHRGLRALLMLSCFMIVVAGLRAATELLVPTMMALFLALLCVPPMRRLMRYNVPSGLAVTIVIIGATSAVLVILVAVGRSLGRFEDQLPYYQERLDQLVTQGVAWLQRQGIEVEPQRMIDSIDSGALLRLVGSTASGVIAALSNVFLIVLTMVFMLLEARSLPGKLRRAMDDPQADLSDFVVAAAQVQRYLAIKAWVSLATGVLAGLICDACGVDFPLIWGLIAFLFNFIPNIGSVIAAIPAILLALVQHGAGNALVVGIGYLVINLLIGNIIEPRLLGRRLGLSTLVVFLSLLFWGWIWGPVGMFLSVPLTVIVKIVLEHSDDFRWLAVLLGPADDRDHDDDMEINDTSSRANK